MGTGNDNWLVQIIFFFISNFVQFFGLILSSRISVKKNRCMRGLNGLIYQHVPKQKNLRRKENNSTNGIEK